MENVNKLINDLEKYAKNCSDEEAKRIEDSIRVILMYLIPKSNRAMGITNKSE